MSDYWWGVLTIPLASVALLVALLALRGAQKVLSKLFERTVSAFPGIRNGTAHTESQFGHRSAFAAMALSSKKAYLFEPFDGLGFFLFMGVPGNTSETKRIKRVVERAYEESLGKKRKVADLGFD